MKQFLIYSLRLRRVEYRIAELPIFLIPVLLTLEPHEPFFTPLFWQGLCLFMFLFAYGDLINCLADRELDSVYKPHLTEAVDGLGIKGVLAQIAFSALGALALGFHIASTTGRWLIPPGTVFGLMVGAAYSIKPFQLKGQGLGQLFFYWFGLFSGPMVFASMMFTDIPPLKVFLVALFYGMLQTGTILINTAEDYPEDREMGVKTAVVALGIEPAFKAAFLFVLCGWTCLFTTLQFGHGYQSYFIPLFAAGLACTIHLAHFRGQLKGESEEKQIALVKKLGGWAPVWITAMALSTLIAALGLHGVF